LRHPSLTGWLLVSCLLGLFIFPLGILLADKVSIHEASVEYYVARNLKVLIIEPPPHRNIRLFVSRDCPDTSAHTEPSLPGVERLDLPSVFANPFLDLLQYSRIPRASLLARYIHHLFSLHHCSDRNHGLEC
jgi:hypothetical protein